VSRAQERKSAVDQEICALATNLSGQGRRSPPSGRNVVEADPTKRAADGTQLIVIKLLERGPARVVRLARCRHTLWTYAK